MIQLEPGEYFGISRQLADPNESATLFVRAVIRNARTDASIDTVDLTDKGDGRFQAEWQVTSTVAGALYISITTYVYTDAGFTTYSDVYSAESETYLVEPRSKSVGGGGGTSISRKMLKEVLMEVLGGEEKAEVKDWTPALKQIKAAIASRSNLSREEVEEIVMSHKASNDDVLEVVRALKNTDLAPVMQAIADIPKTDLAPVMEAIHARNGEVEKAVAEIVKMQKEFEKFLTIMEKMGGDSTKKEAAARKVMDSVRAAIGAVQDLGIDEEAGKKGLQESPYEVIRRIRLKR